MTVWQWRRTGFSPRLISRIDAPREAIELLIVNKGRAAGIIDQVDVLRPDKLIADAEYEGFTNRTFRPLALPAMASMRIIIQAPEGQTFVAGARLLVGIGAAQPKIVIPTDTPAELGIFGLTSVLPPGTPT